ncbi:MAG: RNA-directed DNA polymerase [Actinobacteria bacterium]|nr:RNA-directed DNA polymerase [Actinomycetota bacterium]
MDHSWMMKFLALRIADERVLRLIQKWLRAGVIEDGMWTASEQGSPQGATASPLLANVYLHYVFDLWVQQWRSRHARGEVIVVRYADDVVLGFQHQSDAEQLARDLEQRLARFGLALNAEKTRLIRFGRFAFQQRAERGLGRPETFDFLGFTHYCAKRRDGHFAVRRRTIKKRQAAKLKQVKTSLMARRHRPIEEQGRWLGSVVRGHLAYYSVTGNIHQVSAFRDEVIRLWRAALRRRSQKTRMNWQRMPRLADRYLPHARYTHPWPDERFAARTQVRSPAR